MTSGTVLMGIVFAAALMTVPLCGGRLGALGEVRLRAVWLVFAALAAPVVIISVVAGGGHAFHEGGHLGTHAVAGVFAWLNRRVPGMVIAGIGGALNLAAIAANGGVMPARPGALRAAGLSDRSATFENSAAVAHPHLAWLGDWFALPASWPVSNVFSVGDVVLALGVAGCLHLICAPRPARRLGHPSGTRAFA